MRDLDTPIKAIRRQIFTEIAKAGFLSTDESLRQDLEAIPFSLVEEAPKYRDSIYRERAVASERVRLAMGMSLRPENKPVHLTSGLSASNVDEKYYEPPLVQVIPSACAKCAPNKYVVSNMCRACVAHPCALVCPTDAVDIKEDGFSHIKQSKCIKCGKCKAACPYDAIAKKERPCAKACGVNAITSDSQGRATILEDRCVSCGMCMVNCPFGAISDKSQIFQLCRALSQGEELIAEVAPAFVGQFGDGVTPQNFKGALLKLGFSDVREVALGADIGALWEARHYAEEVSAGKLPFLLTSCCPSWAVLAKKYFPDIIDSISQELTPMVATARKIKQEHPKVRVVFIGPCAAKKLEASRRSVRSDVDFVITFEELNGMFDAKGIAVSHCTGEASLHDATGAGRGYAVSGGVIQAIEACLAAYYPEITPQSVRAQSLTECKKVLTLAKAGKLKGCMIEGMACPGGCLGGAGTNAPVKTAAKALEKYASNSSKKLPSPALWDISLP